MIFVTGLTGNTGQSLLPYLQDEQIVTVSRHAQTFPENVIGHVGDLTDETFINALFERYNFTEVIHIANIRHTPSLIKLAEKHRVKRLISVHTTGVYSKYRSCRELYVQIEQQLRERPLNHTSYVILRPTMIYGNERDHNMHKLIQFLTKSPVFPLFGTGQAMLQPVHVEDLAHAIAAVYHRKDIVNEHFDLSGGSIMTYSELIDFMIRTLNRNVVVVPMSLKLAHALVKMYNYLPSPLISSEQVLRLQEHKAYSHEKATRTFQYKPRRLEEGIFQEVQLLQRKGLIK